MRRPFSRIESGKGAVTMYIKVISGESPDEIARRAGCPLCMLLRANGVLSGAWLEMMDEVRVPDANECEKSPFPCPRDFSMAEIPERTGYIVKAGDTAKSIADCHRLPERLVLSQKNLSDGKALILPAAGENMKIHTVLPMETWSNFENAPELMLINNYFAPLYPGMRILIKR